MRLGTLKKIRHAGRNQSRVGALEAQVGEWLELDSQPGAFLNLRLCKLKVSSWFIHSMLGKHVMETEVLKISLIVIQHLPHPLPSWPPP